MGPASDAELVVHALVMAWARFEPDADGLAHHSGKGGAVGVFAHVARSAP